ncbi:MAG: N-acetylglutaminylglutamine synthetase [Betaproteobacteria bacterium]|nr:N-acetylglutaminylglutamine synthetase [Betaproteobacteria bacterium]MDH5350770.1 N-acetylglutaminylglutamine synthetase [Betaproteobacteria bacterium]
MHAKARQVRAAQHHRVGRQHVARVPDTEVALDCGWGRLLFAQTYPDAASLAGALAEEGPERRDIAGWVREPHLVLAAAPQALFLDPSHTYRLDLSTYRASRKRPRGFVVRWVTSQADADAVNRIYLAHRMVTVPPEFMFSHRDSRTIVYLVAEDEVTGQVIGTVTGVDHVRAFDDPERGSSLWCLAVDPQAARPLVGETLVRRLAEYFQARGARTMDLSVLASNHQAIDLYEKLGFTRLPVFTVKRKNAINERLFVGAPPEAALNPYARIIVDEARRRGIGVEVVDAEGGFFRLSSGGRSILCRESLSELTSAVAMSLCDDKAATRRAVARAGVRVPEGIEFDTRENLEVFLARHGSVAVKPARGEQGRGVSVGLETIDEAMAAVERARAHCDRVLIEQCVTGEDLRLVVIGYKLVAAAIRRPARVIGDGASTIRELIGRQSRRRAAATGGESKIPLDAETERCVAKAGFGMDDLPPSGQEINVRKAANLHTGGTIHDVTAEVHPSLVDAAIRAARALDVPVTGIDFMVRSPRQPGYWFIEANERPGLANHEPQPTAERFIDLLFPQSMPTAVKQAAR